MRYLNKFNTIKDYQDQQKTLDIPNVSLIREENKCKYIKKQKSNFGDIVVYNKKLDNLEIITPGAYESSVWQDTNRTPIGVVAVPAKYTPDHSIRVVSLVNMSLKTPETGTAAASPVENDNVMFWGNGEKKLTISKDYSHIDYINYPTDTIIPNTNNSIGYIPSDLPWNIEYKDIYGNYISPGAVNLKKYHPYPILPDNRKNPLYFKENSTSLDFNGPSNTDIMIKAAEGTKYADWKTISSITNSYELGSYPTAFCCRRFHTPGTKAGDWYLPAIGELTFITTHINKINESINKIPNSIILGRLQRELFGGWYRSSSCCNKLGILGITTHDGTIHSSGYKIIAGDSRTRAFFKIY